MEIKAGKPTTFQIALIALSIIAIDQISKLVVLGNLSDYQVIPVVEGFFNLTLTYNRGAAFGIFAGIEDPWRTIVLWGATLFAFGVIWYLLKSTYGQLTLARVAFALILGGAVGNLIDRVRLGVVVDFLDIYLGSYHWPAFNVADSCIVIGVGLLLICSAPVDKK